ncbi:MAG: thioesterase family protein [Acidobacteria bacterium]|nr:thioesterase family protein [Acidobacteriota bacterium]
MSGIRGFLDLEPLGDDRFAAPIPHYPDRPTMFGGQVAGQALRAAAMTVDPQQLPSSLHAYYVTSGALDVPLVMEVERVRDGRSFANRRVEAVQDGRVVLSLEAAFHRPEDGPVRAEPLPPLLVPPEELPAEPAPARGFPDVPVEVRTLDAESIPSTAGLTLWARSREAWPADDPVGAACLLTYLADMRTGFAAASGLAGFEPGMMTSLDHSLWFHRPVDANGWVLVQMRPLVNADARGLVLGTIHDRAGNHVASFTQEVLVRPRRDP